MLVVWGDVVTVSLSQNSVCGFLLPMIDIRGRCLRLGSVLDDVLGRHDYPPSVAHLVAESVILTALIGSATKLQGRLSLQVRGDGPVSLIATDYMAKEENEEPKLRAYGRVGPDKLPEPPWYLKALMGAGVMGVMIDQGQGAPYQALTPMVGPSLAHTAEAFFAQSEQLATRFQIRVTQDKQGSWQGGGIMLQMLPKSPLKDIEIEPADHGLLTPEDIARMADQDDSWNRAGILLDTVHQAELCDPELAHEVLISRLFHEEFPQIYEPTPLAFGCSCSAEKLRAVLETYSQSERNELITPEGVIEALCEFCGANYRFDPVSLGDEPRKNQKKRKD